MGKESRMCVLKGQVCIFSRLFEKIRIAFMGLSWSRGKIIHENTEVENLVWYSPFTTLLNKYCRGRRGKLQVDKLLFFRQDGISSKRTIAQ